MNKNSRNLCRRGLALFLALVMCLSMLQLTALAAEDSTNDTGGADHVHNAEGWICTPYCDIPIHTHTAECYAVAGGGEEEPEDGEESVEPAPLPEDLPVNDGASTEEDDFGNEYEPPEYIGPSENGDGDSSDPSDPGQDGPAALPEENPEEGGEPSALPEDGSEEGGEPSALPEDGSEEGGDSSEEPEESEEGGEPAAPSTEPEAGGDSSAQPEEAEEPEESEEGDEPSAPAEAEPDALVIRDTRLPMDPMPELQCGMVEHTQHTEACAEGENGGWHCVPDTNITIHVPENELVTGRVDLLAGVTASPANCGNWPVQIAVASVAADDGSEVEPEDGQWLNAEDGVVYTVEYVAYVNAVMTLDADGETADIPEGILAQQTRTLEGEAIDGVARIESTGYATLQEAVDAAGDGAEIFLLADVFENIQSTNKSYTLDLQGNTVNSAAEGKNVITIIGGTVTIQNGAITGGNYDRSRTNQDGKGVLAANADVTLIRCEIKDNKGYGNRTCPGYEVFWNSSKMYAGDGGGVWAANGSLTLNGCTVSGNTANRNGGGVCTINCDLTITGGTKLLDNTANNSGGGLSMNGGKLVMDNATINGNFSKNGDGCGIYLQVAEANIQNTVLEGNTSSVRTNALYVNSSNGTSPVNLKNVEIVNSAGSMASNYAVYVNMKGDFTAEGCTLRDSSGGLYLMGSGTKTLTDCKFLDNDCTGSSTAAAPLCLKAGNALITGCTFTGNRGYSAGAIRNESTTGTMTVDNCVISGNTATNISTNAAGGISIYKATVIATNTVIKENTALNSSTAAAGGVSVMGITKNIATFTMESGALYKNESGNGTANDYYNSSSSSVLKASDMKDGDYDFSRYAWSNLLTIVNADSELTTNTVCGWTAIIDGDVAQIGETTYGTLTEALDAVQDGETIRLIGSHVPSGDLYTITKNFTLDLGSAKLYTSGNAAIKGIFKVTTGELTLTGTGGSFGGKIHLTGTGKVNVAGNVVLRSSMSITTSGYATIQCTGGGEINISGNASYVSANVTNGSVSVAETAHVGSLELYLTPDYKAESIPVNVNGAVNNLLLSATGSGSVVNLNGSMGALTLKASRNISDNSIPVFNAGESFTADSLLFYPYYMSASSDYDQETGYTNGLLNMNAMANPNQQVTDHILIHGGAGGMNFANANWIANINSPTVTLSNDALKHTDNKDYKFLTSVVADDSNNIVLHKTIVDGHYVLVDGVNGKDTNDGVSLGAPVKTFARALEVLNDHAEEGFNTIHVLNTITVSGAETWELGEGQKLESFPTYKGTLATVSGSGNLTLRNISIDGKGIVRSAPLIQNSGILNIQEGTVLTGGINTARFLMEDHSAYDGGAVWNGKELNMSGGTISGNTARNGGGVFNCGVFNLSGGFITGNDGYGEAVAYSKTGDFKSVNAGGGVFIGLGGKMYMSSGEISENTAGMGGGISLGNGTNAYTYTGNTYFKMTGGSISSNISQGCGGGIYIQEQCAGEITCGEITGNHSLSGAFGGGGIYVNGGVSKSSINGKLYLENVAIMNNTASSDGGGVAGCPTSNLNIYLSDGGVITDNTAGGEPYDIYIQRLVADPYHTGTLGTAYISKYMLGGGLYNWMDRKTDERIPSQLLNHMNVFLYGTPETEDVDRAEGMCKVFICDNTSRTTGGGIGTNGDVTIGKNETKTFDITFNKDWQNADESVMNEAELEKMEETLVRIGFVLWRRAINAGVQTFSLNAPVPLAETPESAGMDFGNPPDGDGWEVADWILHGNYAHILSEDAFWGPQTFTDLLADGYEYAVTEITSSTYEAVQTPGVFTSENWKSVLQPADGSSAFVNRIQPAVLILKKAVNDGNGSLAGQTFEFEITLTAPDGKEYKQTQSLQAGGTVTIDTLDGKDLKIPSGTTYTITETNLLNGCYVKSESSAEVKNHPSVISGSSISDTLEVGKNTVTFTNSTDPFGTLTVKKVVDGGSSADKDRDWTFMIKLYTDENGVQNALSSAAVSKIDFDSEEPKTDESNSYTYVQVNLKDGGDLYKVNYLPVGVNYEVTEVTGEGFPENCVVTYTNATGKVEKHGDTFNAVVTNTLPKVTGVEVRKVWDDDNSPDRPESVTVQLYQNGVAYGDSVKLNSENQWSHIWKDLPESPDGSETPYVWTVDETNIPDGYTAEVTNSGNVWTITNSKTTEQNPGTISISVDKVWNDAGNSANRPDSITVVLFNSTGIVKNGKLSEANGWHCDWDGLSPDENWTVEEVRVPGYTGVVTRDGNAVTITNTPTTPPPPGGTTPPGGGGGGGGNPNPPPVLTELPDPNVPGAPEEVIVVEDDVPLAYVKTWDPEEEEFVYMPEEEVPLAVMDDVPETGDSSAPALWTALCLTSAAGLTALYVTKPRKKEEA